MPLPDDITVYPAHGAGSACGKNMSSDTFDSLGNQKKTNYALRVDMTKAEFVKEVTEGLSKAPQYFAKNAQLNKYGYQSIDTVLNRGLKALNPQQFEAAIAQNNALVLDTRKTQIFKDAYIDKAVNIGIDGGFAPWVGAVISDIKQAILIVCDAGREQEIVTRLARVGYDNTIGYSYQPKKAKQLIEQYKTETGQTNPQITITTIGNYLSFCEYIQRELQKTGLIVNVDVIPAATLKDAKANGQLDLFRASWVADYPDAENYLSLYYSKNFAPNGPNYTHFKNEQFDLWYEQAFTETNTLKLQLIYTKMDSEIRPNP